MTESANWMRLESFCDSIHSFCLDANVAYPTLIHESRLSLTMLQLILHQKSSIRHRRIGVIRNLVGRGFAENPLAMTPIAMGERSDSKWESNLEPLFTSIVLGTFQIGGAASYRWLVR